jgi:hypothetical protein
MEGTLAHTAPDQIRKGDELDEVRLAAYKAATNGRVKSLLSVGKDAKTIKGEPYGVRTAVLYMAPADISGYEVCGARTKGCSAACLFTAGQGRFLNVKQGRLRRTYQLLHRQDEFMETLHTEIVRYNKKAIEDGKTLAVRLNGTSDIAYENISFLYGPNIFTALPDIQFYDYTKRIDRLKTILEIPNYHITFSRAETTANQLNAEKALALGVNVTVVFRKELPAMYLGYPVVDGDRHDIRFWDKFKADDGPVIIGLLAKGLGKKDTSGFVVDP